MTKTNNSNRIFGDNGAEYAPLGLYVHIPFCVRKCKYCDFVSYTEKSRTEKSGYIDELCREISEKGRILKDFYYVDTIFFGGGTPSFLESEDLLRVLKCIGDSFVVGCVNARSCGAGFKNCDGIEISFEANPGTVSREKLEELKLGGFNRISIGVQSFNDDILKKLGRIHSSEEAETAVKEAKNVGFDTNLDLMFGIPGQNIEIWKETLERAIDLSPDHISFYSLQLEEGTPMCSDYRYGDLVLPSWEENRKMYHLACDMLKSAGYHHYEISNAAKPGFECRHNMKYWSMEDYIGFGSAAHSYINGKRSFNSDDLSGWSSSEDENSDVQSDFIFTRLRLIDGFPRQEFIDRFGYDFDFSHECIAEENGMIKFNKKGLDNTNPVMQDLFERIKR